jgi:lipopolysaccharide export system protein LptA
MVKVECTPGMPLFYNTQEKHKKEKYKANSRNFSLEFEENWLKLIDNEKLLFEGSFMFENQLVKDSFLKIIDIIGNKIILQD